MKNKSLIFGMLMIIAACGEEEGSNLPSPCELDTPVATFEYQPEKINVKWEDAGDYFYSASFIIKSKPNEFYSVYYGADTSADITSFHPGTTYELIVSVEKSQEDPTSLNRCNGEIELQSFTPPCGPYQKLNIVPSASKAVVMWDKYGDPQAKSFTINLKKKGTTEITVASTDKETIELTSLQSNTEYELQMVSTCTDGQVYLSEWFSFTTL